MKLALGILFFSSILWANGSALGIFIGNPSSLVFKHWNNSKTALQTGFSFSADDYLFITGDYLLHYPGSFKTTEKFINSLIPYIGVGGAVAITTDDRRHNDEYLGKKSGSIGTAIRIPLGIEWMAISPPLSVYFELAPGLSIIPETSAVFMGGLGIRYHF